MAEGKYTHREIENLKKSILTELSAVGMDINGERKNPAANLKKEQLRGLHKNQRQERSEKNKWLVKKHGIELLRFFAEGCEIEPHAFSPKLVQVKSGTEYALLFRFATLLWSVPVSQGYGRRMRYLMFDEQNGKLIGLFALGDPVFNFKVRDDHIGWTSDDRKRRLYNVMDAFVLGAVPPYNRLICGKLVALSTLSDEVRKDFYSKYKSRKTVIENARKPADLVLVTTSSSLGRSSIYNRLKIPAESELAFRSIGFSRGWGHFHISDETFARIREYLRAEGEKYADGYKFGQGPNWRMRTIRRALHLLGLEGDLLRHGIERELFIAPTTQNYLEYLRGETTKPNYYSRPLSFLSAQFLDRWLIPRSNRVTDWKSWKRKDLWKEIINNTDWPFNLIAF